MKIANQVLFAVACVMAAASVLLAAYVSHLGGDLPAPALRSVQSALQLQQFHSLALLLVAWMGMGPRSHPLHMGSGVMILLGLLMFSVNIELIHLAGIDMFRAFTPYGGLAFVAGWLLLIGALRAKS
jgi:uncharacterized membrane protein YgdD (TMEM256/DUF423 family)